MEGDIIHRDIITGREITYRSSASGDGQKIYLNVIAPEQLAEEERIEAARWERAQERMLAKYQKKLDAYGEIRIGDEVFVRHEVIAKELNIQAGRMAHWIRNARTPSGRILQAMQTLSPKRRGLYVSQKDRQWLLENFEEARTPRLKSQTASPNPS